MRIGKFFLPVFLGAMMVALSACATSYPAGKGVTEEPGDGAASGGDEAADRGEAEGEDGEWGLNLSDPDESVPYGIYVGANVAGHCSPYKNSGGFEAMNFDAEFQKIVFVRPKSSADPGPYGGIYIADSSVKLPLAGVGIPGKGEIGKFTFCPDYDGDESYPCHVTSGPHPFIPSISIYPDDPSTFPNVPLVGTPGPLGGGTSIIIFSIGATKDLDPIMEWEGGVGGYALGGALEPVSAPFPFTWDQIMLGEEFSIDIITGDEGETWNWTMRFVPGY